MSVQLLALRLISSQSPKLNNLEIQYLAGPTLGLIRRWLKEKEKSTCNYRILSQDTLGSVRESWQIIFSGRLLLSVGKNQQTTTIDSSTKRKETLTLS